MASGAHGLRAMDDLKAIEIIVKALDAKKAEEIVVLDLRQQSSYLNYFVIATALSRAHLKTLFDEVHKTAVENHIERPRAQAPQFESGWVTYDFGFYVIHLFENEKRRFYNLEGVWKNAAQVNVLSATSSTNLNPRKGDSESVKPPKKTASKTAKKTSAKSESFTKKKTTIKKKTTKEKKMATKKKPAKKKAAKKTAKKKTAKKK